MTDVRLTATNPEDSSVVPVACNAKGELKLEEVPTFDGNVDGDLTVRGSATFAGNVTLENRTSPNGSVLAFTPGSANGASGAYGTIQAKGSASTYGTDMIITLRGGSNGNVSDINEVARFKYDGSAEFAGNVEVNGGINSNGASIFSDGRVYGKVIYASEGVGNGLLFQGIASGTEVFKVTTDGSGTFAGNVDAKAALDINKGGSKDGNNSALVVWNNSGSTYSVNIKGNGAANFAGNKAGFTAEGYLWCTTRRGDTVILDATSNGLASWVPYTPPSRLTELQDRWAEKDVIRPVPEESSQDEPETPQ